MFKRKALCQPSTCCVAHLVPDEKISVSYNPLSLGQSILDDVAKQIDLSDIDYYGLKFKNQGQWLDLNKLIAKQIKSANNFADNLELELRFKFYPADQALLNNETTRYYLYLQLRFDLADGRLHCNSSEVLAYLIACILQSELGDYVADSKSTTGNYVSEFNFAINQTEEIELAAIELHKSEDFQGLSRSEAETNFLKRACQLDSYGIEPFTVKDGDSQNNFVIGVNHRGVSTFLGYAKTNEFSWLEIERITFDNKLVLIYCTRLDKKSSKVYKSKPLFGFRCSTKESAFNFWKLAIEHRYFFTLEETPSRPLVANTGGFLKKNHKLKCSGKVERDLLKLSAETPRTSVRRTHSLLVKSEEGGSTWRGFAQGSNLQTSLSNVFASDQINKTMPSSLKPFQEDEEENNFESIDHHQSLYNSYTQSHNDSLHNKQANALTSQQDRQSIKPLNKRSLVSNNSALSLAADNLAKRASSKLHAKSRSRKYMNICIAGLLIILTLIAAIVLVDQDSLDEYVEKYHLETLHDSCVEPIRELFIDVRQKLVGRV